MGVLLEVEGQKNKRTGKKKRRSNAADKTTGDPWKGVWWTTMLFTLCFLPPLYIFLNNVWTDPMMPQVLSNGMKTLQEKFLGLLGKSAADKAKEDVRKMQ